MPCVNKNDPNFREILSRVGNPLLAEVEYIERFGLAQTMSQELFSKEDVIKLYDNQFDNFKVVSKTPKSGITIGNTEQYFTINGVLFERDYNRENLKGLTTEQRKSLDDEKRYIYKIGGKEVTKKEFEDKAIVGYEVLIELPDGVKSTFYLNLENNTISEGKNVVKLDLSQKATEKTIEQPTQIKEGVEELFDSDPKLTNQVYEVLGNLLPTPQQKQKALELYSEYLDSIFPESKVKEIVYHGTDKKELKKFYDNLKSGIHFGTIEQAKGRRKATDFEFKKDAKIIPTIINLKNALRTKDFDWEKAGDAFTFWQPGDDLSDLDFTEYLISSGIIKEEEIQDAEGDFDLINKKGYDGVIYKNEGSGETTEDDSYAVSKSEQIHILGTQEDIEGFKNYVAKESKKEKTVEEIEETKCDITPILKTNNSDIAF
jgi:hypothetical protein